jgi:hypothetical protein
MNANSGRDVGPTGHLVGKPPRDDAPAAVRRYRFGKPGRKTAQKAQKGDRIGMVVFGAFAPLVADRRGRDFGQMLGLPWRALIACFLA